MTAGRDAMRPRHRELPESEREAMAAVKDLAAELWDLVDGLGASRETSIAKTKIEEAAMWAVKHITR